MPGALRLVWVSACSLYEFGEAAVTLYANFVWRANRRTIKLERTFRLLGSNAAGGNIRSHENFRAHRRIVLPPHQRELTDMRERIGHRPLK